MDPRDRIKRLQDLRSVAAELRASAPAPDQIPDMSASILSQVDAARPFLNAHTRRSLWVARAMCAGSVALIGAGVFAAFRFAPDFMPAREPAPLSTVVQRVQRTADTSVTEVRASLTASISTVASEVQRPITAMLGEPSKTECASLAGPGPRCQAAELNCLPADAGAAPFVRLGDSVLVRLRVCGGRGDCSDRLMLLGPNWRTELAAPVEPCAKR